MPTYKGNRGNLLQHWVLAELIGLLKGEAPSDHQLCFVDAHAMSPYATRDSSPGQSASVFDIVRRQLPGQGSAYEQAWKELIKDDGVEYPTSAMFVRHLWPGPLEMVLCETDKAAADDIGEWSSGLKLVPDLSYTAATGG
jgi:hypothetical protein